MTREELKEPCEDVISRHSAIRLAEQGQIQGFEWQIRKLTTLPSVTPKGVTITDFADKCRECGREKVLDKIMEEIEQVKAIMNEEIINNNRKDLINFVNGLNQSLVIVERYKAESEEEHE